MPGAITCGELMVQVPQYSKVRGTSVAVAEAFVLSVSVKPEIAVTKVLATIPVPETELPTTTEVADVRVTDVLPDVVSPVRVTEIAPAFVTSDEHVRVTDAVTNALAPLPPTFLAIFTTLLAPA